MTTNQASHYDLFNLNGQEDLKVTEELLPWHYEPQVTELDLSIVIPTRNERDNVLLLLEEISRTLAGIRVEVLFVDDSDDDTPEVIKSAALSMHTSTLVVRMEHRIGKARAGGLATAVLLGIENARADYVAVIDADLQHPPEQLRVLFENAVTQNVDLVLASRYIEGGSYDGLDGISRRLISVGFKWTAKLLFPERLLQVSDPLGGFFLFRRQILEQQKLRPIGYKILLEILIRGCWQQVVEVPYHFHVRANGTSKADTRQGVMVLQHMWRLLMEVPAAGRIWKIATLLIMNALLVLTFLVLSTYLPDTWNALHFGAFVATAGVNFLLLGRTFPRRGRSASSSVMEQDVSSGGEPDQSEDEVVETPKTEKSDKARGRERSLLSNKIVERIPFLMGIVTIGWIIYTLPGAWILIGAFFIGLALLLRNNVNKSQTITMILAVLVGLTTVDYLTWRFEVINWSGWWIALPLIAAETLGALHALGFQYTLWPKAQASYTATEDASQLPVVVFVPTVNEGAAILEPTLKRLIEARKHYLLQYPHGKVNIVVCNDGYVGGYAQWQETEELAHRLGVQCVTRTVGGGAKAGNIEHARQQIGAVGETLLVIFDADQIARPDFLLKTVPPFGDTTIGWVQTGQYYRNLENPVANWADDQQAMFYSLLCPGKASSNASFICGTNVVIRAKALDQIGGFPQDSITEDFSASIELHPHWRSLFLSDVLATGLGPMDMPSFLKQQRRWATGTLSVLRSHWRAIFLPQNHGLNLEQRIQYLLACTHYLCGLRDLIYLICPILFIITGVPAVKDSTLQTFLWHFLPYLFASVGALWYTARGVTGLKGIIIGFGSFPVLIESLLSAILKRKVGFAVTSKQRESTSSWRHVRIHIAAALISLVALVVAMLIHGRQQASMFISMMWIVYTLIMLGSFLWLSYKDMQLQKAPQVEANEHFKYPSRLLEREQGLRPVWNLVGALSLASLLLVGGKLPLPSTTAAAFTVARQTNERPYIGIVTAQAHLASTTLGLEKQLNTQFAMIGRTQDIQDRFDRSWADQLAQQHERPWITLEFGNVGANGKAPIAANLTAISNGVHDQELKQWAQEMRDYGKPVYLTVLLHVDRNWSVSSAVANGGIPQDSARAWTHIQSIFQAEGAHNVAWVWSPADPAHDSTYAPPEKSIDVVLLSLIHYPGTAWVDPKAALQEVIAKHPTKPIILEVSADGLAAQKAAWLSKVGVAVDSTPNVHALIYHEGSPDINATPVQDKLWSILSDPASLATMRQITAMDTQSLR